MADLKTDYQDDVLDTSVNEKRKYKLIQNEDGTVSFEDVTEYTKTGDSFGSKDMNDTNAAVNLLNSNLTWKYLGSTSGINKLNLPTDFSELNIEVSYSDKTYMFNIIKGQLTTEYKRFWNGYYYDSNYYGYATICANSSDIYINNFSESSSDVTSSANLNAWYR